MSLQAETDASGSPRSRSSNGNGMFSVLRFTGDSALKERILTASVLVAVLIVVSVVAETVEYGRLAVVFFTASVAVLGAFEAVRLIARNRLTSAYMRVHGVVAFGIVATPALTATVVSARTIVGEPLETMMVLGATAASASVLLVFLAWCGRHDLGTAEYYAARYAPAFVLVSVCAPQLVVLSAHPRAVYLLWWLAGCTAFNDMAAYFAGKALGRAKVAPALSPNKTVEGSLAGLCAGTAVGWLLWGIVVEGSAPTVGVVVLSLGVVVAAQAADLAKSYLKRLQGVKDTGALFPGHGGVLDRFDAMIGAAPLLLAALMVFGLL